MDYPAAIDPSQFIHVRMVLSMVVSLALARLLSGLAKFVQHPKRLQVDAVHLLWSAYMLVMLLHFWWWEFSLIRLTVWTFGTFAFVLAYSALLYLLCALLYPDDIHEYDGYRGYFSSRRMWFFGTLAFVLVIDVIDTWLKGPDYLAMRSPEIGYKTAVGLALCLTGAISANWRIQLTLAIVCLLYQASWIARLYSVLQ